MPLPPVQEVCALIRPQSPEVPPLVAEVERQTCTMGGVPSGLHVRHLPQEGQGQCCSRRAEPPDASPHLVKVQVIGFESLKDSYTMCPDFGPIVHALDLGIDHEHRD